MTIRSPNLLYGGNPAWRDFWHCVIKNLRGEKNGAELKKLADSASKVLKVKIEPTLPQE